MGTRISGFMSSTLIRPPPSGPTRIRTGDLLSARQTRYQLRYKPKILSRLPECRTYNCCMYAGHHRRRGLVPVITATVAVSVAATFAVTNLGPSPPSNPQSDSPGVVTTVPSIAPAPGSAENSLGPVVQGPELTGPRPVDQATTAGAEPMAPVIRVTAKIGPCNTEIPVVSFGCQFM